MSWLPYFFSSPSPCTIRTRSTVRFELVGNDHRQGGARGAGSHLGASRHDGHGAILGNRQEDVRVGANAVRHLLGAGRIGKRRLQARDLRREHKTASGRNALQHVASADVMDDGSLKR